jgi:hypothetical protein
MDRRENNLYSVISETAISLSDGPSVRREVRKQIKNLSVVTGRTDYLKLYPNAGTN